MRKLFYLEHNYLAIWRKKGKSLSYYTHYALWRITITGQKKGAEKKKTFYNEIKSGTNG